MEDCWLQCKSSKRYEQQNYRWPSSSGVCSSGTECRIISNSRSGIQGWDRTRETRVLERCYLQGVYCWLKFDCCDFRIPTRKIVSVDRDHWFAILSSIINAKYGCYFLRKLGFKVALIRKSLMLPSNLFCSDRLFVQSCFSNSVVC